jgi:hypothetical protein
VRAGDRLRLGPAIPVERRPYPAERKQRPVVVQREPRLRPSSSSPDLAPARTRRRSSPARGSGSLASAVCASAVRTRCGYFDGRTRCSRWRWHAPTHDDELGSSLRISHDRSKVVSKDAWHGRQIPDFVIDGAKRGDDRGLVRGDAREVAHGFVGSVVQTNGPDTENMAGPPTRRRGGV